jgi:DNA helicase II / ATP-dependent DNA helicase PcrA
MPKTALHDRILGTLNEAQREAVTHGDEPLLVIAGAGSGKTTTLVHRVARLIAAGVPPQRILLLTFTRRSAADMLRRAQQVLPKSRDSGRVWAGTFHATGARLLRMYGDAIGLSSRFTIHDRGDSEDLMRSLVVELKLNKEDNKFPKKGTLMAIHSFSVNAGRTLEQALQSNFPGQTHRRGQLQRLFAAYQQRKHELDVLDYDDLLTRWCALMEHDEVGPRIRTRFDHVLVDEYQDTNPVQSRLLKLLRPDGRGLTVVGDDAQSIYAFRAATVRNILDFPKQFPNTRVVKLEQNYRSTVPLLAASNEVIAAAREQFKKELWSERTEGSRPQLITCYDEEEQSEFVVARILAHRQAGLPLRDQAVLFRASHHSISLETELAGHSIPFVKYGGLKFVESAHVKDLMCFLRLAENPRDVVAGTRVLALLPGIGPKKAAQLMEMLATPSPDFRIWTEAKTPAKTKPLWPHFLRMMQELTEAVGDVPGQIERVLHFYQPLLEEKYDNPDRRIGDLEQLQQIAAKFQDRTEMLSDLTIDPPSSDLDLPEADKDGDYLVLSTMHSAKGLEWPAVYVLHANEGMIPQERSYDDPDAVEEERRLFYVALTRAADRLYVCHTELPFQRGGYGDWSDWDDDGDCELTRFLSHRAQRRFDRQSAAQYRPPDNLVASERTSASSRKPAREKNTSRRARRSQGRH